MQKQINPAVFWAILAVLMVAVAWVGIRAVYGPTLSKRDTGLRPPPPPPPGSGATVSSTNQTR